MPVTPNDNETEFRLGDLPLAFQKTLVSEFVPYSVGLARITDNDPASFRPLGSGTLVQRRDRFGILTAYHCLHAAPVSMGPRGTDTLLLTLRGGNMIRLEAESVVEHELAKPPDGKYGEWGPDLTFLEVAPANKGSILAYGSAWNMEQSADALSQTFARVGCPLVYAGFPEARCETDIQGKTIFRLAHHETGVFVIEDGDIQERENWDYLTSKCDYAGTPSLLDDFGGLSGGSIWAMEFQKKRDTGVVSLGKSALVGVIFYQMPRVGDHGWLRGHFIKSIYGSVWDNLDR